MKMRAILLALCLGLIASVPAFARDSLAVAQDGSDGPALAHTFGPQADVADGLDIDPATSPYRIINSSTAVGGPGSADPDNLGAFRFLCNPSHTLTDDPIVKPTEPHHSHGHMFFGNTLAAADSTYTSLRTTGDSTCNNKLWRSSYWAPLLLDGPGVDARVIWPKPGGLVVYYKRYPAGIDCNQFAGAQKTRCQAAVAHCTPNDPTFVGTCVPLPNGLRNIAGYDMATGTTPTGLTQMKCIKYSNENLGGYSGAWVTDIPSALAECSGISTGTDTGITVILDLEASMPQCWDGVNLDSPTHRTHVVDWAQSGEDAGICPKTHPYLIPQYTIQIQYDVTNETYDTSGVWTPGQQTLYLSSDLMDRSNPKLPGSTFHFDLFDAGNSDIKAIWDEYCTNGWRNCSAGVLGDGSGLAQPATQPQHAKSVRPKMYNESGHGVMHGPM